MLSLTLFKTALESSVFCAVVAAAAASDISLKHEQHCKVLEVLPLMFRLVGYFEVSGTAKVLDLEIEGYQP